MWPTERDDRSEPEPALPGPWLAAYVDGELDEAERARVEAWLNNHPAARAEVEAQRRLGRWFEAGAVPEPALHAWEKTLSRIETALLPAARRIRAGRRPWRKPWLWAVGLATAAAVLLAVWVAQNRPGTGPGPAPGSEVLDVVTEADVVIDDMDPADAHALIVGRHPVPPADLRPGSTLPVTDSDDVTIISMDAADTAALVVGEPPVSGELVLASQGEVQVDHMAPSADNTQPYLHAPKNGWPMVVAPFKTARGKD
jgi:hypothetical protein